MVTTPLASPPAVLPRLVLIPHLVLGLDKDPRLWKLRSQRLKSQRGSSPRRAVRLETRRAPPRVAQSQTGSHRPRTCARKTSCRD